MIHGANELSKLASLVSKTPHLRNSPAGAEDARTMPNAAALFPAVRVFAGRPVTGLLLGAASSWHTPRWVLTLRLVQMLLTSEWPFGSH